MFQEGIGILKITSESRQLHLLIDGIKDYAILMLDRQGRVETWSLGAEIIFGHRAAQALGEPWAKVYDPDDRSAGKPDRDLQIAASHGRFEDTGWKARADRSRVLANTVISPLWDKRGNLKGYSVVMRDMTESRRAEKSLREKDKQLEQAKRMEAIGRLAGGVAHHFNNLITGIMAVTQAVCKEMAPENPFRPELEEVIQAAGRAAGLTRQLLAFGRRQVSEPRILDITKVVGEMKNMLRRLLPENVDLVTTVGPGPLWVQADRAQMDQILVDLVLNARDAMPSGGRLTIRIARVALSAKEADRESVRPGAYVCTTVCDTGVGMSENTLAHLFEPFYTTKEQGEGTGLGMASIYGIVKQNKAHISVQSQVGKGTTFKILWPESEKAPEPAAVPPEESVRQAQGARTILFVEDEKMVRRAVSRLLKLEGYTVYEAENGRQAMDLWERLAEKPDLLMTDLVMPGMNGRQLAEWVRNRRPSIAVLFISGYSEEVLADPIPVNQHIAYLEKPFTNEELLQILRSILAASADPEPRAVKTA